MHFRNLTILQYAGDWSQTSDQLEPLRFVPCTPGATKSEGWANVRDDELTLTINGHTLMVYEQETKLLPASVILKALKERIKLAEQETGRKPGRKQVKELREDIEHELTAQAFSVTKRTSVWIDHDNQRICIDSTSASAIDSISTAIVRSAPMGFECRYLETKQLPSGAMSAWIASGEPPQQFTIDRDCELKGTDHNAVAYKNECLDRDDVRGHIQQGKVPTKVAMTFAGRVSFVLNDKLQLTKVRVLDINKDMAQDAADAQEQFDADFTIMTGEYADLINNLTEALGGSVAHEDKKE